MINAGRRPLANLININQLTQTEYKIQIENNNPCVLILKQSYHPLWQASFPLTTLQNIKINFVQNVFIINNKIAGTVNVWYEGDKLLEKGIWITALTIVIVVIFTLSMIIRKRKYIKSLLYE